MMVKNLKKSLGFFRNWSAAILNVANHNLNTRLSKFKMAEGKVRRKNKYCNTLGTSRSLKFI